MIDIITGISMIATTVALHVNAAGFATSTASTTVIADTSATTSATEQTIDASSTIAVTMATTTASYRAMVKEYFKDDPILIDVARCESEFRQYGKDGKVIRGIVNDQDVGIMQINEKYHLEASKKLGYDIYTPEGNLAYAKYIYEKQGAAPWVSSSPCWSKSAPIAVK